MLLKKKFGLFNKGTFALYFSNFKTDNLKKRL